MKKTSIGKIIGIILFIALLIYLAKYTNSTSLFTKEVLEAYINSLGWYAPLMFIGIYIIVTILFLPASPVTLLGGFVFGGIWGTIYVVIGATIGALIAFWIARFLGQEFVDKILKGKLKKIEEYDKRLKENGFLTVLFFRLIPIFPFNGLNFALGLTKVRMQDYTIATAVGIIPGTFIFVNIGSNATNFTGPKLYLFIGLFVILALLPTMYKKWKEKKKENTTK